MKYLILDYALPKLPSPLALPIKANKLTKLLKKTKLFQFLKELRIYKQLQQKRQLKQFVPECREFLWQDMSIVRMTLPMPPNDFSDLPISGIQERIVSFFNPNESIYLLEVQEALKGYVTSLMDICENRNEIYIMGFQTKIKMLCEYGYIKKRNAWLLFLDDGTYDVAPYILALSRDWNYVSVYSSRHEVFEDIYHCLYKEEGLMVECIGPDTGNICKGDIVIDFMGNWNKNHRLYPINSYVLDFTFSHEKEEYLHIKKVHLLGYVQAADLIVA